jgi:hypothetical protein
MRTFPLMRKTGEIFAFEIYASGLWTGSLERLLQQAPGVTHVRRVRDGDNRLAFHVRGEPFVVWEPFGDNSRYWIGPQDTAVTSGNASYLESYFKSAPKQSEWFVRWMERIFSSTR